MLIPQVVQFGVSQIYHLRFCDVKIVNHRSFTNAEAEHTQNQRVCIHHQKKMCKGFAAISIFPEIDTGLSQASVSKTRFTVLKLQI